MTAWLLPVLALHLLGMVMWIAGLLAALLALGVAAGTSQPELRRVAARALRGLAHPGAAISIVFGIGLVFIGPRWIHQGWLHAKLALVVLLIWLDLTIHARVRRAADIPSLTVRRWHGALWVLFLGILFLAVLKPF